MFVEAPSTMNELLLAHYLLKTNPDKRFRRWVLSNMVGNTYYHNFVTHLLENTSLICPCQLRRMKEWLP